MREEDFLASKEIKAHFTGEHIEYPVENCRLVCIIRTENVYVSL
jgi:hypothetical protein